MHARSALFDLYGDHLRTRGSQAPVAAVVRLLAPVGIAAPAVRTAISRMVMQGWLEPVQLEGGRGYRATERATARLDRAAERIYRLDRSPWDGAWHLLLLAPPSGRAARHRLRADLAFVGYAELADHVWVSPFVRPELPSVLDRAGVTCRTARATDVDPPPTEAWDLAALHEAYTRWPETADVLVAGERRGAESDDPDEAAFAVRFHLVHEWRKFLFADPGLPAELLPEDWPGHTAAERFAREASRLKPGADRFVARCLGGA
jgi:phenylacetic acid degradation operon negative regulatory protein